MIQIYEYEIENRLVVLLDHYSFISKYKKKIILRKN